MELSGSKVGRRKRQDEKTNKSIAASATRTSKRLREKKDHKCLTSVSADSIKSADGEKKRASSVQRQRRSRSTCRFVYHTALLIE